MPIKLREPTLFRPSRDNEEVFVGIVSFVAIKSV